MALAASKTNETIQLTRYFPAAPAAVFAAWADPRALEQWFGPPSHRCEMEQFDFRPGGRYRIRMIPTGADSDCAGDPEADSVCAGEFLTIEPPHTLALSFTWLENGADIGETVLTVEFREAGSGTDLTLTHERLRDPAVRDAHRGGWEGTLDGLAQYLA